jgi:hypothetical protein
MRAWLGYRSIFSKKRNVSKLLKWRTILLYFYSFVVIPKYAYVFEKEEPTLRLRGFSTFVSRIWPRFEASKPPKVDMVQIDGSLDRNMYRAPLGSFSNIKCFLCKSTFWHLQKMWMPKTPH